VKKDEHVWIAELASEMIPRCVFRDLRVAKRDTPVMARLYGNGGLPNNLSWKRYGPSALALVDAADPDTPYAYLMRRQIR
jgi:hypothetical protein